MPNLLPLTRVERADFHYRLPRQLIASRPPEDRDGGRLLHLDPVRGERRDLHFRSFPELLRPGDLLVLNDSRVLQARLYAEKATGGRVELLLERLLDTRTALAQARNGSSLRPGAELGIAAGAAVRLEGRENGFFRIRALGGDSLPELLRRYGRVPLPPYLKREAEAADRERYQTVYARRPGSVAAPTAGLHFTRGLLERIAARGVRIAFLTLHVGAATFLPLRVRRVERHRMHTEWMEVSASLCRQVAAARARGGRVVAVGTTAARALETAARHGAPAPFRGETGLFIYPGFRFRATDALLTNFHLPESSLLLLVSAFAGRETVLAAYRHAVSRRYRFYSYGDAMFIAARAAWRGGASRPAGDGAAAL